MRSVLLVVVVAAAVEIGVAVRVERGPLGRMPTVWR